MKGVRLYAVVIGMFVLLLNPLFIRSQALEGDGIDEVFARIDFNTIYYPEKAKLQFDSVMFYMDTKQMVEYEGYVDYIKAQLYYGNMQVDSSLAYVENALSYFTNSENNRWLARCQFLLGNIAESTGLYEQAKINYYETVKLEVDQSKMTEGAAYIAIGRCKMALGESFKDEIDKGIHLLQEASEIEVRLYADFMEQYFRINAPDAPEKLNSIANEYINRKLYDRAVSVYKILASSYHAQLQFDSAHVYCDKAIEISEGNSVGKLILPALYQFKGMLYFKQEKFNIADVYFSKSLKLYEQNYQSNRMLYVYNYLHQIDKAKGNYSKAYENLQQYIDWVEKTSSSEKVRLAKVLEINNKVDLMKSQLVQLKIEKKASEFMLYLVMVVTLVILAGVGVYIYLYQKSKKAKIEELNKEFHNLLIGIGEKQLLQHRLNNTKGRVDRHSLHLESFDIVGRGDNGSDDSELSSNFDSCYLETINLFTEAFPQLTRTEIRYAVMICLRLPMEIISKVQNVQPASVRKAKQRIRTKLNVIDSLEDYLQEFREKQISDLAG
ncbi:MULTISPECIES: tetratricopeptide repeat protein [unclassified Saccharicrinis]|uniref:tetratricopeptide repeat protein n=1 Tax=unclassified Saccharicrinis TaxID=2646859 RepID=UPI003D34150E